jgi:hypothetical protein
VLGLAFVKRKIAAKIKYGAKIKQGTGLHCTKLW